MAAPSVPEHPVFVTESEREVWERLVASLGEQDVVLSGVRLTDEDKDHEADLVVLMPGAGVVVVEVKGSTIWTEGDGWRQRRRGEVKRIDPVDQARSTKYAIRR